MATSANSIQHIHQHHPGQQQAQQQPQAQLLQLHPQHQHPMHPMQIPFQQLGASPGLATGHCHSQQQQQQQQQHQTQLIDQNHEGSQHQQHGHGGHPLLIDPTAQGTTNSTQAMPQYTNHQHHTNNHQPQPMIQQVNGHPHLSNNSNHNNNDNSSGQNNGNHGQQQPAMQQQQRQLQHQPSQQHSHLAAQAQPPGPRLGQATPGSRSAANMGAGATSGHGAPGHTKKELPANGKKTKGRVRIKMEFIHNKLRRYTTFSKRKTGIMKKAFELATLTGTQVMLLVASETGHVYTFATRKLQPMIISDAGKALIQTCLNSPDQESLSSLSASAGAPVAGGGAGGHSASASPASPSSHLHAGATQSTANLHAAPSSTASSSSSSTNSISSNSRPAGPTTTRTTAAGLPDEKHPAVSPPSGHLITQQTSPQGSNSNLSSGGGGGDFRSSQQHMGAGAGGAENNGHGIQSQQNVMLAARSQQHTTNSVATSDQRMSATGFEETDLSYSISGDLDDKINLICEDSILETTFTTANLAAATAASGATTPSALNTGQHSQTSGALFSSSESASNSNSSSTGSPASISSGSPASLLMSSSLIPFNGGNSAEVASDNECEANADDDDDLDEQGCEGEGPREAGLLHGGEKRVGARRSRAKRGPAGLAETQHCVETHMSGSSAHHLVAAQHQSLGEHGHLMFGDMSGEQYGSSLVMAPLVSQSNAMPRSQQQQPHQVPSAQAAALGSLPPFCTL